MTLPASEQIAQRVRAFYEAAPFNCSASTAEAAERVRLGTLESVHPDVHELLRSGEVRSVLEFGCGTGWLASTIAHRYSIPVTGVDFAAPAIRRSHERAKALGVGGLTRFELADLFTYRAGGQFDLVVTEGVLHHTYSAREAFARVREFVAPGKYLHLGLYHRYGRAPFRDHLRQILERAGEEAAFREYSALDSMRRGDAVQLRSWFRDQVLHPHESSHTLREVTEWLSDANCELVTTSLNGFREFERLDGLFALEERCGEFAREATHVTRRYYPGFFTVLAQGWE